MDGSYTVGFFALAMFAGSFVFGILPMIISMSSKHLNAISAAGAGLLLGSALLTIIPEGVETLQESMSHSSGAGQTPLGLPLTLGFVLMLLVENFAHANHANHAHPRGAGHFDRTTDSRSAIVATAGLVVHAMADGIALGAAASTEQTTLKSTVFAAIMLHKGPSAFGLVSYLLRCGIPPVTIRRHLLVFSLSAPVVAVLCKFFLSALAANVAKENMERWTGLLLLFSAGTFLYVATLDILPAVLNDVAAEGGSRACTQELHLPVSSSSKSGVQLSTVSHTNQYKNASKASGYDYVSNNDVSQEDLVNSFGLDTHGSLSRRASSVSSAGSEIVGHLSPVERLRRLQRLKTITCILVGVFFPLLLNYSNGAHH